MKTEKSSLFCENYQQTYPQLVDNLFTISTPGMWAGFRGSCFFCGFSEDSFLRKGLTNPHEFYIIEKMFN